MKDIVVVSGKGGTGKTSIAAALGVVAGESTVMVDCDVGAANLHLLYEPKHEEEHDFWAGKTASIDYDTCTGCGLCAEKCRFDAIDECDGCHVIDDVGCDGCSVCHYLCPEHAIEMKEKMAGRWFLSRDRFDHWFVHARLGIGEDNSGKLVSQVKAAARQIALVSGVPFVIVDGPPGIGCPTIASLSGAHHVLIVTEASQCGLHDLRRIAELVGRLDTTASCVINKADLSETAAVEIERMCEARGIDVIARIPYDPVFLEALQEGKTLMEVAGEPLRTQVTEIWKHVRNTGATS